MNDMSTPRMKKEKVIENLKCMVFGSQAFDRFNADERETLDMAIKSVEKLNKIEEIINDPIIKSFGSIGTNKIREILREEDKSCQMQ